MESNPIQPESRRHDGIGDGHLDFSTFLFGADEDDLFGKDVSHESLSQLFGRPLDDARKIFGVSRTAFKSMCRDVGIERWKYGKRNMGRNPSKPCRRRLNDEEPGRRNFSAGMPPVQEDTPVVADTSHESNKMTVKATEK